MAALYMAASFVSIYLYQLGYSITIIAFFWAGFYLFKTLTALPITRFVGWIGPKHSSLVSNLLYIPAMIAFALLPQYGWGLLIVTAILQGISATMYSVSHLINFSKVKSVEHAGKEIAYMNMFEKITTGLSPLVGGLIAFIWGPQVVIIIAAILFATAALPLLRTGEQVRVGQKLQFKGFPWRLYFGHAAGQLSYGFDVFTSGTAWTTYVAIAIIGVSAGQNDVYAVTGVLVSVVFIVAIIASYTYGKIIDRKRGRELMRAGVIATAATHAIRPFVASPVTVAGMNAAHELGATAYNLPYTRAVFDNADLSGARVTYLGVVELTSNLGAGIAAIALGLLSMVLGDHDSLRGLFFIGAATILLMLTVRFPLYKK